MKTERTYADCQEPIAYVRERLQYNEEYPTNDPAQLKPPIGVRPYTTVAVPRINDLLGGIGRYVNADNLTREQIEKATLWAKELEEQLNLIGTMLIYEGCGA